MFRLQTLTVLNHQVLGNAHLEFCHNREHDCFTDDIYTSVVIGVNGIGKSHLMRAIADIFSYLDALARDEETRGPEHKFLVKYRVGVADYEFANYSGVEQVGNHRRVVANLVCKMNGQPVSVRRLICPARIIASTMTVTDKFSTVSSGKYIYRGIRNEKSPNTTGTRTMIRKTVRGLLHSLDVKEGFREELIDLLGQMGLEPHIEVGYTMRYKEVFLTEDMAVDKLCRIFDNQRTYFRNRNSPLWGTGKFQTLRQEPEKLRIVANFLRDKAHEFGDRRSAKLSYNVLEDPLRVNREHH